MQIDGSMSLVAVVVESDPDQRYVYEQERGKRITPEA